MKQHIPWRNVKSNAFNSQKFKGNYEVINDWDLPKKVYVYEPQTLAELPDDANELDYQKVWNKFRNGGHVYVYLVPYESMPELDIDITSEGADWDGLNKNGVIAGYTNIQLPEKPTKRFYSFEPLVPSETPQDVELWEENNLTEVINNDGTFKQTSFTFTKFEPFDGGEDSYYRDVRFFFGVVRPKAATHYQIEFGAPSAVGQIFNYNLLGDRFKQKVEYEVINEPFGHYIGASNNQYRTSNGPVLRFNYIDDSLNKRQGSSWFPQFLVPKVSGSKVNWMVPWVWEFLYAYEQRWGTYNWSLIPGSDGTADADIPGNSIESGDLYAGYNGVSTPNFTAYRNISENSFAGSKERLQAFKPYGSKYGLPFGLSCHGTTYNDKTSNEDSNGLFGLEYSADENEGIRPKNQIGVWTGHTNLFVWDYAYDPTVVGTFDAVDFYLSYIRYGAFYTSELYQNMIRDILDGNAIYQGSSFMSDLGILKSIEDRQVSTDIRTWQIDEGWTMALLPWDTLTLAYDGTSADEDNLSNPYLLNSPVKVAPAFPKFDSGIFDDPLEIRYNAGFPFFGKYIDEDKASKALHYFNGHPNEKRDINTNMLFSIDEQVSSLEVNYYAFGTGTVTVKFFIEVDGYFYELDKFSVLNERAQGRSLSGGTIFTWI